MKQKKMLAILMTVMMVLTMMPLGVFADADETVSNVEEQVEEVTGESVDGATEEPGDAATDEPEEEVAGESATKGFADMPNNWSTSALEKAVANGLLKGYAEGDKLLIKATAPIKRAEMAAVVNRAFGAVKKAGLGGVTDVAATSWYADDMAKAVMMGTFMKDSKMRPEDGITRQEAFTVLARAFKITSEGTGELNSFTDKGQVAAWAENSLSAMVTAGYVQGSGGKINPKANISRAEFAVVMDNLVKQYIVSPGEVTGVVTKGNVLVRSSDVTLRNVTINGDLIIADGVGEGDVTLDGVTVTGRTVVRGGGENSIVIKGNSDLGKVIVYKVDGKVRIAVQGGADVEIIYIEDGSDDVKVEGTIGTLEVGGSSLVTTSNATITTAILSGEGASLILGSGTTVKNGEITGNASGITVDKGATVENIIISGDNAKIGGSGTVKTVEVKEGADGASVTTPNTKVVDGKEEVTTPPATGGGGGGNSSANKVSAITITAKVGGVDVVGDVYYKAEVKVTMTSGTAGAEIYYTLDGSEPTKSSDKYNGEVTLTAPGNAGGTITIKAKGFKDGSTASDVTTKAVKYLDKADLTEYNALKALLPANNDDETYTEESWTAFAAAKAEIKDNLQDTAGQAAVDAEVVKIHEALDLLEVAAGKVSKVQLEAAITSATANKGSVEISTLGDGTDVAKDKKWVTQAVSDTYGGAITAAQGVFDDALADQEAVDQAVTDLATATGIFNAAKADGTQREVESVETLADINVANGTAIGGVSLPATVEVTLDDATTENLAVTWDTAGYDGNTAGTYTFAGTLTLPGNNTIANTANVKASVKVVVAKAQYTVTFDVNDGNGTLTAEVDGDDISSGGAVEEGKDVVFTATPDAGYQVRMWKKNNVLVGGNTTNNLTVENLAEDTVVIVEFQAIPPTTYTVTFSVVGGNGTLTAEVDGSPIGSGDSVRADKTIEFTATPNPGYKIKQWTEGGTVVKNTSTQEIITDTEISWDNFGSDFTLTVEFEEVAPLTDAQKLAVDKTLIEAGTYEIPLASQTNQTTKTAWVQGAVDALIANGTTAVVSWNSGESKYDVALTNGGATGSATITVTEEAALPAQSGAPELTAGTPATFDTEMTVGIGTLSTTTNLTYTWYRSDNNTYEAGTDTELATGTTYTPVAADVGKYLIVVATSTDASGNGVVATAAVVAKAAGPEAIAANYAGTFSAAADTIYLTDLAGSATGLEAAVAIDGSSYGAYAALTVNSGGNATITGLAGVTASTKVKVRVAETATHLAGTEKEITVKVPITQVTITNVTAPVGGQAKNIGYDIPEGANYSKVSSGWWDVEAGNWLAGNYVTGKQYRFQATVEPNVGYMFAPKDEMTASVNGKNATEIDSNNKQRIIRYIFTAVAPLNNAPTVKAGQDTQSGNATPASNDGKTTAVPYTGDASGWFEDADVADTLTYALVSAVDESSNDVSGAVQIVGNDITYTPAAAQAEKTVTIVVKASDGTDDSTGNVTITVTVGAVPADKSTDATLTSTLGTVDNDAGTIVDIPNGTTLAAFKAAITPAAGASFEVYKADGTTEANDLASGYKVIVTAQDGTTTKTYTITILTSTPSATVADITVDGTQGVAIDAKDVTITIANDTIKNEIAADTDLAAWITNLPAGLVAKAKAVIAANATEVVITISGTPTETLTAAMTIEVPAANLTGGTKIDVTANANAKFAIAAPELIGNIAITVTAPAIGQTPDYVGELPAGAKYAKSGTGISWQEKVSQAWLNSSSIFEGGKTYKFSYRLKPNEGYIFTIGTTTVTVNGGEATLSTDGSNPGQYIVSYEFYVVSTDATLTSTLGTVDNDAGTIVDIPNGTTLAAFKAAITPAAGASFEVYQADGTTEANDLASGYKVIVTAQDGTTTKTYTVTVLLPTEIEADVVHAASGSNFTGVLYTADGKLYYNALDAEGKWGTQTEVATGVSEARLAIDGDDNPHVVYTTSDDKIGYRKVENENWAVEIKIGSLNGGKCKKPDISVDNNKKAHITYTDTMGDTGGQQDKDDIMYASNAVNDFLPEMKYRGYYENWGGSAYFGNYFEKGSLIEDDGSNYFIITHFQEFDRSSGGTAYKTYSIKAASTTPVTGEPAGRNSSDLYDIYDMSANNGKIVVLYRDTDKKVAELTTSGNNINFTNPTTLTGIGTPHSLATDGTDIVVVGLNGSALQAFYNGSDKSPMGITVKAGTKVAAVYVDGKFYAVYTDNSSGEITMVEVNND
ncbi:MAG: S-layer homology domain-containing protein [Anaerovoracaceae bacterium]